MSVWANRDHNSWVLWLQQLVFKAGQFWDLIIQLVGLALLMKNCSGNESANCTGENVCTTSGCVRAASILLENMNPSVDPCTDFYMYACGGYIHKNAIPDEATSNGVLSDIAIKVLHQTKVVLEEPVSVKEPPTLKLTKRFYASCMDTEAIESWKSVQLWEDVQRLGGMALLSGNSWRCNVQDVTTYLAKSMRDHADNVLFQSLVVMADLKMPQRTVLNFDQGEPQISRDYFLSSQHRPIIDALKKKMIATVDQIAHENGIKVDQLDVKKDVDDMINFETEYARILTPPQDRRNITKLYNLKTMKDLKDIIPFVDWSRYLAYVVNDAVKLNITEDTDIVVFDLKFFKKLAKLVHATNCRTLNNYILWRVIDNKLGYLNEKYEQIELDFQKIYSGTTGKPKRWPRCQTAAVKHLPQAVGALYIRRYFQRNSRTSALQMIEAFRATVIHMIHNVQWMRNDTKAKAIEKAKIVEPLIGYPDLADNDTALEEYHKLLHVNISQSYYEAGKTIGAWMFEVSLLKLLKPTDRADWQFSPALGQGRIIRRFVAVFPAAILQAPTFDADYPKYWNYGGIGFAIGHEITHGFDDQGRLFNKWGVLQNWWDNLTLEEYNSKAQCLIDQYAAIVVPNTNGTHINGELTLGENIADNGGVKEAYMAYRGYVSSIGKEEPRLPGVTHLTPNQIFFLSSAQLWCGSERAQSVIRNMQLDPHTQNKYRVNVPRANLPQFSRAFKCPRGSPMNPIQKCSLW